MLKTIAALAVLTHPMFVTDQNLTLKALRQKALDGGPQFTRVCAIPLRDPSGPRPNHMDPIGRPVGSTNFDKMAHPADVPACPQR